MVVRKTRAFIITFFVFVVLLSITFFVVQKKSQPLESRRVALLDVVGNNYIFRGNSPIVEKDGSNYFAYNDLKEHINVRLKEKNIEPLQSFYLVSVSLLDINEYFLAKDEESFFEKNPHLGEVINVSLFRPSLLLQSLPISFLNTKMSQMYSSWFTQMLAQVRGMAEIKSDIPRVIYVHCNAGRDRTGMFSANYKLLYDKEISLKDISLRNQEEAGRDADPFYHEVTRKYCLYLKDVFHKSWDCGA